MSSRNGSVLIKTVAGIVALGAAGAGALHFSGACPLSSCGSGDKAAGQGAVTTVAIAGTSDRSCCPGEVKADRVTATEAAFFEAGAEASCEPAMGCEDARDCDGAKPPECGESKSCEKSETIVADNTTGK